MEKKMMSLPSCRRTDKNTGALCKCAIKPGFASRQAYELFVHPLDLFYLMLHFRVVLVRNGSTLPHIVVNVGGATATLGNDHHGRFALRGEADRLDRSRAALHAYLDYRNLELHRKPRFHLRPQLELASPPYRVLPAVVDEEEMRVLPHETAAR